VIGRLFSALPGPTILRIVLMGVMMVASLALLILCYEWLGNTFLDTGGRIG
jgi:hypothetical protein